MYHYTTSGLNNVYLLNGYKEIDTGYGKGISIHDLHGLHKAIGESIVNLKRPLKGEEIRFLRIELDMSQSALGLISECSDQTIAKWEKNSHPIPRAQDLLIRSYYAEKILHQNPLIGEFIDMLNKIDKTMQKEIIKLAENEEGWHIATAA